MSKLKAYRKFIVAAIGTAAYSVGAALSDDVVTNSEWVAIATAVLIALGVYTTPNDPPVEPETGTGVYR